MQEIVTYKLEDMLAARELDMVIKLLTALKEQGWPEKASSEEGLRLGFNRSSGNVWLESDCFDCVILNSYDQLEPFLSTPCEGHEGFITDLVAEANEGWTTDDLEYLLGYLDKGTPMHRKIKELLDTSTEEPA